MIIIFKVLSDICQAIVEVGQTCNNNVRTSLNGVLYSGKKEEKERTRKETTIYVDKRLQAMGL